MAIQLADSVAANIRLEIDAVTADPKGLPNAVYCVVGKNGQLFHYASGKKGKATNRPVDESTVFWMASCTKMLAGLAAMQLVERGKLHLDDPDEVETICPELRAIKILQKVEDDGTPVLVEKKNRITLRMLLTHTAGFQYAWSNVELAKYGNPIGIHELSGYARDIYEYPLVFEPGTAWQYGIGLDWAGELIMRVSGMSLNDYLIKNIFQPLGLRNISMFPDTSMKNNLAHMHLQDFMDGTAKETDHVLRLPLMVKESERSMVYNAGGAGCFGSPSDYCEIIATLLNDGTSPTTGAQILQPATIDEMFRNQIPQFPDFARQGMFPVKPGFGNPVSASEVYPLPPGSKQGHGLSFMITMDAGPTGRGANTAQWCGMPNMYWWADRERGVGGMLASQILPLGHPAALKLWHSIEQKTYEGIKIMSNGH